jgi:hypothetical protein
VTSKKFRIEIQLEDGSNLVMTSKGCPERSKVTKFLDLVELMGGGETPSGDSTGYEAATLYEKLEELVARRLRGGSFRLVDVREAFELEFGSSPSDSTVATYLARMSDRGLLRRSGRRGSYKYMIEAEEVRIAEH